MTDLNQVVDSIVASLTNIGGIVAAMKQTNTSMVPLRQQILVMWRDNLSAEIDNIAKDIDELKEFELWNIKEKTQNEDRIAKIIKKTVPKFSVKNRSK